MSRAGEGAPPVRAGEHFPSELGPDGQPAIPDDAIRGRRHLDNLDRSTRKIGFRFLRRWI